MLSTRIRDGVRSAVRAVRISRAVRHVLSLAGMDVQELPRNDLTLYAGFARESLESRAFYNIGAGKFRHPYWTNIDLSSDWYSGLQNAPFINHDLMSLAPLPLCDERAEII